MNSCEDFFQRMAANATEHTLVAIPSERDMYPNDRDTMITAGTKTKATASNAIVMVYAVPVDFLASNIENLPERF